jgi:predicted small metal-binding protein
MIMERYFINYSDYPSDANCTLALSADTRDELLEAVVQHATTVHETEDTPEFREMIVKGIQDMTLPFSAS